MSPTRRILRQRMMILADRLGPQKRILEVGIAGDDPPGANREWFKAEEYKTLDRDETLKPDIVADLEDLTTAFMNVSDRWDLVICSQVLEHVRAPHIAVDSLWSLVDFGGHCIIDTPFLYPPHDDARDGDYWRFTPSGLKRLCETAGFTVEELWHDKEWLLVQAVCRKGLADA